MNHQKLPRRSIMTATYLTRTRLEAALEKNLENIHAKIVLDIGSGKRYYETLFSAETTYLALDIGLEDKPNMVGIGECLPIASESIDLVICIQVLEHVDNPNLVIQEISRVLRPSGTLLLTTHGTMFYHPTPNDYWRWTETGLEKIVRENGQFKEVLVEPVQGSFETLGYFLAWYTQFVFSKITNMMAFLGFIPRFMMRIIIAIINISSILLDRMIPILSKPKQASSLIGVYLVKAVRK